MSPEMEYFRADTKHSCVLFRVLFHLIASINNNKPHKLSSLEARNHRTVRKIFTSSFLLVSLLAFAEIRMFFSILGDRYLFLPFVGNNGELNTYAHHHLFVPSSGMR